MAVLTTHLVPQRLQLLLPSEVPEHEASVGHVDGPDWGHTGNRG